MKKILFILFSIILTINVVSAQQTDYNALINSTTMPTDAEIMNVIDKFEFTPDQKEQLFKETKRQLKEIYENKNTALLQEKIEQGQKALNEANINVNDLMNIDSNIH